MSGMQVYKLTLQRLLKQQQSVINNPIPGALVARQGTYDFHFCLFDMQGDFKGGYYHGMLQLHQNHPFKPPKLFFYTPNGRFQPNTPICTTFTNYHQQSWTSAWNVRSLVIATISFMQQNQPSYGCRDDSPQVRRDLAQKSMRFNRKNMKFMNLFQSKIKELNRMELIQSIEQQVESGDKMATVQRQSLIQQQPLNQAVNQRPFIKVSVVVIMVAFFILIGYCLA